MSDFLSSMASSSLLRAEGVRAGAGERGLRSRVASARPALPLVLDPSGFDLIAEAKLTSPSEGRIARSGGEVAGDGGEVAGSGGEVAGDGGEVAGDGGEVALLAREMTLAGAAAISVLTEPEAFDGTIQHLETVASSVTAPVMRKDFLVDPIQILEARAHGAAGVLLIARITGGSMLAEMTDLALELGMFVLVEVFEKSELDLASVVFDRPILVGVNARDLVSLEVVPTRHAELLGDLPPHLPSVAESGIRTAADAKEVSRLGYSLALVGTSLVASGRPAQLTREMIGAGR